ncbi:drebrin-like protein A isoform X2 [Gadus morhua]|uniref:drebrin-like protein A isoform X2 n=1 Tax=Gadus morhua TaxID=8049 RepID=UPI0011B700C2|nr:drebrin-like protein A isoform X2 [Gadus morhua]
MTMQAAVNLDTYNLSLLTAKEDILNPRSSTNWALFTYEGISNKLKLADSGAGGVAELAGKFHMAKPQYGLCRIGTAETGGPCIAMISWMGQNVDEYRRTECSNHMAAIRNFFKESHVFISAEKVDDVTEELIAAEHSKVQARAPMERVRRSSRSAEKEETVGTNYRKTNAAMEMRRINRDSFWACAEREEEQRKEEERRRMLEDRRRLERERVQNERREADERDRKMNEKLQMIEEQRRKEAQKEEELRGHEKSRWVQQQREHEDNMRARLKRSESIEMAAEAAVLVSQRSMNPREFFRQLSSSSKSPLSPTSPRSGTGRPPARRYQRSLTDTAFIFSKAPEDSSPRSPPFVSPFSRGPASPMFRSPPPTSPDFHPSPQSRPPPAKSPPPSPVHPGPPDSAPPSLPSPGVTLRPHNQRRRHSASDDPATAIATSPAPLQPSAPPASLLASCPPGDDSASPAHAGETTPMTPPESQASQALGPGQAWAVRAFSPVQVEVDPVPQAPSVPLPVSPQPNRDLHAATPVHTELDSCYIAQAVLVEEEEEEEENEVRKGEDEPAPEPRPPPTAPPHRQPVAVQTEEPTAQESDTEPEAAVEGPVMVAEDGGAEDEELVNDQQHCALLPQESSMLVHLEEEPGLEVADTETNGQQITQATVIVSTNGFTNGDTVEENGIERSLSPSDTELSSPELSGCYHLEPVKGEYIKVEEKEEEVEEEEAEEEEEKEEKEKVEVYENGQEEIMETQMCVKALYDYQADESEISFEPGDIISDVETVDEAWWSGCSKDGQQGLFPANYVEHI